MMVVLVKTDEPIAVVIEVAFEIFEIRVSPVVLIKSHLGVDEGNSAFFQKAAPAFDDFEVKVFRVGFQQIDAIQFMHGREPVQRRHVDKLMSSNSLTGHIDARAQRIQTRIILVIKHGPIFFAAKSDVETIDVWVSVERRCQRLKSFQDGLERKNSAIWEARTEIQARLANVGSDIEDYPSLFAD